MTQTSGPWKPDAEEQAVACEARRSHRLARIILPLYRVSRLRRMIRQACLRLEGGQMFSESWRQILKNYHEVDIGRYSYGDILRPGLLPPGTSVGNYCSVGTELIVRRRNHPLERPILHPFFYNSRLGFLQGDTIEQDRDVPLSIGHDVWIADRVTILSGCRAIGNGAVIAAGAVVTRDVPPYAIMAGVPARQVRLRFAPARIAELEESRWWERDLASLIRNPPFTDIFGTAQDSGQSAAR
ncbi:MAG: CatB-related O-acetyltransferase [Pseudorhodobacter sp.]